MMTPEIQNDNRLSLDSLAVAHLAETAKWARFLAIVGFVMIGLLVIVALGIMTMGSAMFSAIPEMGAFGSAMGVFIGMLYLVMAAIALYPNLKLYHFANKAKAAIASGNSQILTESMGNLKSMFKFYGVLMAIVLVLYGIIFLFAIVANVSGR